MIVRSVATRCVPAALLLAAIAGCGGQSTATSPGSGASMNPTTSAAATSAAAAGGDEKAARCTAADLTLELGKHDGGASGQVQVPLTFTNSSSKACDLTGVPGVDLRGPDDPNGPTYSLPRPGYDKPQATIALAPGASASAPLTYLIPGQGDIGSSGSKNWVPTEVVVTPPGDTKQLTAKWTSGDAVLRQDSATHPGAFVGPVAK